MRTYLAVSLCVCFISNVVWADTFGSGGNQLSIDFVTISGETNPTSGYGIVNNAYRMGKFEITNDQWMKFANIYGTPFGSPASAYDESPYFTGTNVPTNEVSWYEAAQFVNWLNTSTNHHPAYKFTGTPHQSDYTFVPWSVVDAGYNPINPYRNSNAYYFLPTEDEYVKAAYWNGSTLQTYATKSGDTLHQGDGVSGTGWNYYDGGFATGAYELWDVGSGSEELNGTFDMMGNVWEWVVLQRDIIKSPEVYMTGFY